LIISGDIRALGGNATVTFNVSDADGVSEVRTIVLQAARSTILLPIAVR
jgi:hypothetical protein